MGVKVWIEWDSQYERYYTLDFPTKTGAGPVEISNELYERFMEHERESQTLQGILESLEYDWQYPEEVVEDCD